MLLRVGSKRLEPHNRRAPAAAIFAGLRERSNRSIAFEELVHGSAQFADAAAMNDAHFEDAAFATGLQKVRDDAFDVLRAKRVQVEDAFDRQGHGRAGAGFLEFG